jgi:predicted ArsR family transcriptional regulator
MKTPTRLRILDQFRKHQTATVKDLSQALGMTGANIRHHLAILESNDVIELIRQKRERRGRPVNVYGLSRRILGDGLDELAGAVFNAWLADATDPVREAGLKAIARQLTGNNQPDPESMMPKRLALAIERLNELHYQARWEASASGARLLLGHCPYVEIIGRYPDLCRMDKYLLELYLGVPTNQTAKLEPGLSGLPQCIFLTG